MSNETKHTNCATNVLGDIVRMRRDLANLYAAKDAIEKLEYSEYCDGGCYRLDIGITRVRLGISIEQCEADLRKAEKQYYGV